MATGVRDAIMRLPEIPRHRGPVTCAVELGGEPATIASGAYDGAVALTDVDRRRMVLLGYHEHLVNRITVGPGGRMLASASSDHTIGLWDLARGELIRTLKAHSDDVEDFAFLDERTGVSASRDRRLIVWDLEHGTVERMLVGHDKDVLSVSCFQGRAYSAGDDMTLRVWDVASGRQLHCIGPFEHETDTCAIDPRRRRAILGCDDGVLRAFSLEGEPVGEQPAHASGIKIVAVSPTTGDIFSAAYDRQLRVWDAATLTPRRVLEPLATAWERSFSWTPDGRRMVAGTFDGTVVLWDAESGRRLLESGAPGGNACFNEAVAIGTDVVAVADDGQLRLGRLDGRASAWRARREPRDGRVLANAVAASADAGVVVTGAHDQTVRVFDLDDTLRERAAAHLGEGPINSVEVVSIGGSHRVLAACYSGRIVQLDMAGEVVARFAIHEGAAKSLCVLPEQGIGISCGADGTTFSWTLDRGERVRSFPAHTAIVNDVDVDAAGDRIATVGRDFVLNVYGLAEGRLLQALPLSRRSPKAVTFVEAETIAVGDYWGHVASVSLRDGRRFERRIATNGISSLRAQSGERLVASSYDGALYLLDATSLDLVDELRAMTQRQTILATAQA